MSKKVELIMPGLRDRMPCKSRPWFEGYVVDLHGRSRAKVIVTVRGDTLEEMRVRKHVCTKALQEAHR